MQLELVQHPDERLTTKITKEWDFDNPQYDASELRTAMLKVMKDNLGIGLSANQVGIMDARCFVFFNQQANNRDMCETLCLHPSYEVMDDSVDISMWEGCLSFPNLFLYVNRPDKIDVNFLDIEGKNVTMLLEDFEARIFLHEFDHLEGITFDTRVSKFKLQIAREKQRKLEKK